MPYGRFTEGFDTADLKYTGALLDELSEFRSWLSSALQSPASARPNNCSDRTFGRVSTDADGGADLRGQASTGRS
jgi:hypothetical protein